RRALIIAPSSLNMVSGLVGFGFGARRGPRWRAGVELVVHMPDLGTERLVRLSEQRQRLQLPLPGGGLGRGRVAREGRRSGAGAADEFEPDGHGLSGNFVERVPDSARVALTGTGFTCVIVPGGEADC